MTLTFPNRSRSFDEARRCVRFVGYDGMFEVQYLVDSTALRVSPSAATEAKCLAAFDAARTAIQDAAARKYEGRRQLPYVLTASDMPGH